MINQDKNFEEKYPNITRWVADGSIEIGSDDGSQSFIRAYDEGGEVFAGKSSYSSLDEALADAEEAVKKWFDEND